MKRSLLIGIAATLCVVVVAISSLLYYRRCYFTTPTKTYATLTQAIKEGVITNGWLPDFLPRTAYNIREKHNVSHNTIIAAFSFDPAGDKTQILAMGDELPKQSLQTIRPSVICRKEPWFPDAIVEGSFEQLAREGFKLYRIRDNRSERIRNHQDFHEWYMLIHQKNGICYLWGNL